MSMAEYFIRKEVMEWALWSDEGHDVDSCWTLQGPPLPVFIASDDTKAGNHVA